MRFPVVDATGFLTTANVGQGRIFTAEADLRYEATDKLLLAGSFTYNSTSLSSDTPSSIIVAEGQMANVPELSALFAAEWSTDLAGHPLSLSGITRYTGRSRLGLGPVLDRRQGDYADLSFALRTAAGPVGIRAGIDNLLASRGKLFGLGSIGNLDDRSSYVPQSPRSFSIALEIPLK